MRDRLENIEGRLALGMEITPPNVDWLVGQVHRLAERIRALQIEIANQDQCIKEARIHVYRQQHGKHEQDRADALAWLGRYGSTNDRKMHNLNRAPWVSK